VESAHADVRRHLRYMRAVASASATELPLTVRDQVDKIFTFLHDELPLMQVEQEVIYAAIDRLPNGPQSTQAMVMDHEVIRRLIHELDRLAGPNGWKRWRAELQPRLFVLEALLRVHIEKEDRLYGPFLDRIDAPGAASIRARLRPRPSARGKRGGG
jgi:hemerythrin-like domain-containing protein